MARKAETEEVKAFKATLKGLPTGEVQELTKQYKELVAAVAAARERAEIRKSLTTLPTEELQAEIDRRKKQNKK